MSKLSVRWKQLPEDLQRKILPYTYSPQSDILLEDIRNYHTTLKLIKEIYKSYCDNDEILDWIINDIHRWLNNDIPTMFGYTGKFITTIKRNPYYYLRAPDIEFFIRKLDTKSPIIEVHIFWGLLTADERKQFICRCATYLWRKEWLYLD